ncbi:MAG: hypothetical protein ACU0C9_01895, partial [Paracoccaceae bacterium]
MRIAFQHLRDTDNVGDRSCSPYDYFDWPDSAAKDLRTTGPAYDLGILGGGKIFGGLAKYAGVRRDQNTRHIAWGVSTVQNF